MVGGHGGSELQVTAEVPFQLSLDGYNAVAPVFVQPNSDIPCLLGINVIPSLGIRVVRSNGTFMVEAIEQCQKGTEQDGGNSPPDTIPNLQERDGEEGRPAIAIHARVYLVQSVNVPGRKGTVVEARV